MERHRQRRGRIFVISGPSGSGKTTLARKLLSSPELKKRLVKSVSLSTRPRRSQEKEGRDYFFISPQEFRRRLKEQKILEWTKYLGYYYATPRDFAEQQLHRGKHILLCLDLKGARKIKRFYPRESVTIFVLPPSLEALRKRIEGRCSRTKKEEIRQRLRLAQRELMSRWEYDYSLANDNLEKAAEELRGIILKEAGG